MKLKSILFIFLLQFLFFSTSVFAGVEINSVRLKGDDIKKGLIVKDQYFNNGVSDPGVGSKAILTFGVDEFYQGSLISIYSRTINVDIKFYYSSGLSTTVSNIQLTVEYDSKGGAIQKVQDVYFKENFYKMEVIFNSISNSTIPSNLYLEGRIETERYYDIAGLDISGLSYHSITYSNSIATVNELNQGIDLSAYEIFWKSLEGAEYYELEYAYIDNYNYDIATDAYTLISGNSIKLSEYEFAKNNTRVITSNTYYRLPAVYPRGYIVYRVRAVGFNQPDLLQPVYSDWSSETQNTKVNLSDWPKYFQIKNQVDHQKNYQVVTTFAEDGKKKEVMSFYDGSNRQRQTITRLNSIEKTIVGETYYDYIGRQSLVLLPVPDNNDVLHYKENFNVTAFGYPVPSIYDVSSDGCTEEILTFSSSSGASEYYSAQNSYSNFTDGIPDANGYVYSKTVYKKDNTQRIKYQSSPGELFRPGQKNTNYYYSKPGQAEINGLFGDNVGNANHYKKNLVVDPNGQASVSYLNPAGKTIATALEGDAPTNLNLVEGNIQANPVVTSIDVLGKVNYYDSDTDLDNNYLVDNGYALESSETILVSDDQTYDFVYKWVGASGVTIDCFTTSIPLLLTLYIIDECGEYVPIVPYFKTPLSEVPFNNGSLAINNVPLKVGSYTLIKRLEIDPIALEQLHDEYMDNVINNCFTLQDYIVANTGDYEDPCAFCESEMTCVSTIEDNYNISIYFNSQTNNYEVVPLLPLNAGSLPTTLPSVFYDSEGIPKLSEINQYLNDEIQECENTTGNCDNNPSNLPSSLSFLQQLLSDVGLFGQYGGKLLFDENVNDFLFTSTTNNGGVNYIREHLNDYTSVWSDARRSISYDDYNNEIINISYQNIYNFINDDNSYLSHFSWKFPTLPLGETAGHYLDEFGQPYKIYLNFDGNDPLWDGTTGTDPNSQSDDVGFFMYPEQLAKVTDFKNYWQSQWSENLVFYHPEYPVYKFYKILSDDYYFNVSSNSEEFDQYILLDFINGATGGPLESMGLYTPLNFREELISSSILMDPFFFLDTDHLFQGISPSDSKRIAFQNYYADMKTNMTQILTDITGSFLSGYSFENNEIATNCSSLNIDLLDIANYFENCNTNISPVNECSCIDLASNATLTESLFFSYITLYQSEKEKMIQNLAERYADVIKDGYSTNCIGADEGTYYFGYSNYWDPLEYSPCDWNIKPFFSQKDRRIIPQFQENSVTLNEEEQFVSYINETESQLYEATGLTNFTYSFSQLLLSIFSNYNVGSLTQLLFDNMDDISSTVYFSLTGDDLISALNNSSFNYSYDNLKFVFTKTSNVLTIKVFGDSQSASNILLHNFSITKNTSHSWANYNLTSQTTTKWFISDFDIVVPDVPNPNEFSILANTTNAAGSFNEQIELVVKSNGTGSPAPVFVIDLTPDLNVNCESNEFLGELISLLNLFGQNGIGELMFQSFPNDRYTRTDFPDYTFEEIPTIIDDIEKLETMAYYQLEQSNAIIEFFGGDITGFSISSSGSGTNSVTYSFGLPTEQYSFTISSSGSVPYPDDSDYFDDFQLTSSTYTLVSGYYDYNASVELYKSITPTTFDNYTLDIEIRNTELCEFFGTCLAPNECSPCLEAPNNTHFTDCCKPWFLPIVTCEDAYTDYVAYFTNNGTISLPNVKTNETSNGLLSQEDFCNSNLNFYWNDYELYLNFIDCSSVNTLGEDVIDQYDLNPLYISLSEFANLNFQDYLDAYEDFISGVLSNEQNGSISMLALLNNEYYYLANGQYNGTSLSDFNNLISPALFVELNINPDCLDGINVVGEEDFIYSLASNNSLIVTDWINTYPQCVNLPYCPPILPMHTSFDIELPVVQPCFEEFLANLDTANVANEWAQIIENYSNNFYGEVLDTVFDNFYEMLNYTYDKNTYHKTLYYYDLAGNLSQTIPPKGVNDAYIYNPNTTKYPTHTFNTQYKYNSFNQLIWQSTPDGGVTEFWYDKLGRLVASQNANQKQLTPNKKYSYTIYDGLGRISEVGVVSSSDFNSSFDVQIDIDHDAWPSQGYTSKVLSEVVRTYYDTSPASAGYLPNSLVQQNLRNRVSATAVFNTYSATFANYNQATFYSYDIHGNVNWLVQEIPEMATGDVNFKYMEYDYDLISGNVNSVSYQPGEVDQFYHKYKYDDDNRITEVYTSKDNIIWQNDARYLYYDHGPLARVELGENKVQGLDYFYTLQGWLKGVNSNDLTDSISDLGQDNLPSGLNPYGSSDAFGFTLDYYANDFNSINSTPGFTYTSVAPSSDLYNGNIKGMNVAITHPAEDYTTPISSSSLLFGSNQTPIEHQSYYTYDQLNRIKKMKENAGYFQTQYTYDENGNLSTLWRYDHLDKRFDKLTYRYATTNNKLTYIDDGATGTTNNGLYNDLLDQAANNYVYDNIGNLTKDVKEKIGNIVWFANGKMRYITQTKANSADLEFLYDASGNRIAKKNKKRNSAGTGYTGAINSTYYIRDASGNVMATYQKDWVADEIHLSDQSIYGSSRLGIVENSVQVYPATSLALYTTDFSSSEKIYELSNHLGNVMETITDHKIAYTYSGNLRYGAEVTSMNDYFPFGMLMPNRHENSAEYRYGFNGMEKDDEVKGQGNSYDFGARIYDPRIGRWLSLDPLMSKYPDFSPYSFVNNMPIWAVDPDGKEIVFTIWDDFDENWKVVTWDQLDYLTKEAVANYLCTASGEAFLAQFAKKGDNIGGKYFTEDGKYSTHIMTIGQFDQDLPGSVYGYAFINNARNSNGEMSMSFAAYLNIGNTEGEYPAIGITLTLGHETFIHLDQWIDQFIEAFENDDSAVLKELWKNNRASGMEYGDSDHEGYINEEEAYEAMYVFIKDLKGQLPEKKVENAVKVHDEKYKKLKK